MDSNTTSIVTALGGGSGIDMLALANNLAEAQFAGRTTRLAEKEQALEQKISAASDLRSQISLLASALGDRVRNGDLAPTPQIGNASVAQVSSALGSPPAGDYSLEVLALAAAQTLTSPAYTAAQDLVGSGTLTLRFGTVTGTSFAEDTGQAAVGITIASGATLAEVAEAINAANSGVTAYIAQASDGARLVLKGDDGAANGFVLEAAETPGDEGLAALAWEPTAGDPARFLSQSADAHFILDGIDMVSASNNAANVAPGLSLVLTGTNAAAPTQIRFSDPVAAISTAMQDLTSALNEIASALNQAINPLTGELARDDGARTLRRDLSRLAGTEIMPNAAPGEARTLADLGLATERNGTFRLDTERLQATLARDPEGAAAMFTNGLFGVYATVDKIARSASVTGNPGSLAGSVKRYNQQVTRIGEQSADIAEQHETLRARLARQFGAADARIGVAKSTLSFLEAQIAVWNGKQN